MYSSNQILMFIQGAMFIVFTKCSRGNVYSREYLYSVLLSTDIKSRYVYHDHFHAKDLVQNGLQNEESIFQANIKGQLILKRFFEVVNFPQKMNE